MQYIITVWRKTQKCCIKQVKALKLLLRMYKFGAKYICYHKGIYLPSNKILSLH